MDPLTKPDKGPAMDEEKQALMPAPATAVSPGSTPRRQSRFLKAWVYAARLLAMCMVVRLVHRMHEGGFSATRSASHLHQKPKNGPLKGHEAKKLFLSIPDPDSALGASRLLAGQPHLAGSPQDFEDAKTILDFFQSEFEIASSTEPPIFSAGTVQSRLATLGISVRKQPTAWIDTYYPVMNTPLDRSLQVLSKNGNVEFDADLVEDGDLRDPDAAKYRDAVPTWHGLSCDGDVEGQLIYVDYGRKSDYDKLVKKGVDFNGKIVIARYGEVFRGLKIKAAEELGAAGVLIYNDPRDDGHVTEDNGYEAYPAGPARNPTSVQRGSVQYLSLYPGDPTTPGYPAYENATRTEGTNIPKIPSLPISWVNAKRVLAELNGDKDGRVLNGQVSEKKIKLVNHVDTKVTPIWNTIVSIPGHIHEEVVLVAAHRDAWVLGGADPVSGTVSLREAIRGFGELYRHGWRPLRTLVFASWDAEEYGLIGSTEWGEDFPHWISSHVVSYINVDVSVTGSFWFAAGSPSLAHLIRASAQQVPHPTAPHKTLWDARGEEGPYDAGAPDADFAALHAHAEAQRKKRVSDLDVPPLGSGSDFTVFLQRLGIAAMDQSFGAGPKDAVYHYHSIYDSQHWQETYADPGFHRHVAVAKHLGLVAFELTESIILPLNTTQYAYELDTYLDDVEDIAADLALSTDFSPLRSAIHAVQAASEALDAEKTAAEKHFRKILRKWRKHHEERAHARSRLHKCAAYARRLVRGAAAAAAREHRREERLLERVWGVVEAQLRGTLSEDEAIATVLAHAHAPRASTRWGRWVSLHLGGRRDVQAAALARKRENKLPLVVELIRATLRVKKANLKLVAFERGFIDAGGIKDREWYRHLGVAPGKWLGYGATTFPALTEALTIDNSAEQAAHEAQRLTSLFQRLAKVLNA